VGRRTGLSRKDLDLTENEKPEYYVANEQEIENQKKKTNY